MSDKPYSDSEPEKQDSEFSDADEPTDDDADLPEELRYWEERYSDDESGSKHRKKRTKMKERFKNRDKD